MMGLERGKVKIEPYRSEWIQSLENEKQLIKSKNGKYIKDVQHVGSTSIAGLDSKLTDITEGPCKDGKLYLDPILDCFDGKNVAFKMDDDIRAELCMEAFKRACQVERETLQTKYSPNV